MPWRCAVLPPSLRLAVLDPCNAVEVFIVAQDLGTSTLLH